MPSLRDEVARAAAKARTRTSDRALPKLTRTQGGVHQIVENLPVTKRVAPARFDQIGAALDDYLETLPLQWARVVGAYRLVDVAHKVVGVGSVGLRAFLALLVGSSPDDVLFLQLKQARRSVIAPFIHGEQALHAHQGQRVVEYQQAYDGQRPVAGWATLPPVMAPGIATQLSPDASMPGRRPSRSTCGSTGTCPARSLSTILTPVRWSTTRGCWPAAGQEPRPHLRRLPDRRLPWQVGRRGPRRWRGSPRPTPTRPSRTMPRSARRSGPVGCRPPMPGSDGEEDVNQSHVGLRQEGRLACVRALQWRDRLT